MADEGQGTGLSAADDDRGPVEPGAGDGGGPDDRKHDGHSGPGDREHVNDGVPDGPESGAPHDVHGAYAVETPEQVLADVAIVRRRTRLARHGYWFPLVLFGLLTCASIPFYIQHLPARSGVYGYPSPAGLAFLRSDYLGAFGIPADLYKGFYWLAAILIGVAATAVWYRWRGNRVGLRTPARGFVITGAVLLLLALGIPALAASDAPGLRILMPGDLLIRGTFPLVIIGIGLGYLAWAERSIALIVIAAGFLTLSLVASLYDIENVLYKLGWNLSPAASGLPNVVLPALVLLLSGAGAWAVQRRYEVPPARPADSEAS